MNALLIQLLAEEHGQDLAEYTLLMAFVVVAAATLIYGMGDSVKSITSISTSQLNAADAAVR